MPNRRPTRKRGILEQTYLPEVFHGLAITARHAARSVLFPDEMDLLEYPEVRKRLDPPAGAHPRETLSPRFKGAHRLLTREGGKLRCVACMCCPTVCPARCITIVAGEDPTDALEKYPVEFTIDMLRCIYCGYCVEACPKDAIRMDTGIYDISGVNRQDFIHDRSCMVDLVKGGAKGQVRGED